MPWNMQDYPDNLKNFDEIEHKKIVRSWMLWKLRVTREDLIPIAIQQGKEWYQNASDKEIAEVKQTNPKRAITMILNRPILIWWMRTFK